MYGGLEPNLTQADVSTLADVVATASTVGSESEELLSLVDQLSGPPVRPPYLEGYDKALEVLELPLVANFVDSFVDIESLLGRIGVSILPRKLETATIRGVSLAGEGLAPTILINQSSVYNENEHGVRFTLAHEFAHLLYDRSVARSVGIASGPWAPAGVEKRANAFAAMFLMPRSLVIRAIGDATNFTNLDAVSEAALKLRVGTMSLIEHLANMDLIGHYDRDVLRGQLRQH